MVVSDAVELGSLFRKKKKKSAPIVAANTNFNFPAPIATSIATGIPTGIDQAATLIKTGEIVGQSLHLKDSASPEAPATAPGAPVIAPTFMEGKMPWIVGGGIVLLGIVTLVILKKSGKI